MNDFVLDASVAVKWLLEDESGREYSLAILASLADKQAVVPALWFYEVGNSLLMACRRKRISAKQLDEFLNRLIRLPVILIHESPAELLEVPALALRFDLSNYDSAYLSLAYKMKIPLATVDDRLRRAALALGSGIVSAI